MGRSRTGTEGTVPPWDEIAEKGVIGSLLVDQDAVNWVSDICLPADFYGEANRELYDVILALHKDGCDIDAITVSSELQRRGSFDRVGGAPYMDALVDVVPSRAHVEQYAKSIAKCSQLRSTDAASLQLSVSCRERAEDEEVEAAVERVRQAWEAGAAQDRPQTLSQLVETKFEAASEWLVKGWWLWQGCGLWAAEEKSSKTTLAQALGMCVAAGKQWLGRYPTRQGTVLALFEEDHERTIRRRGIMLGKAQGIDPHLDNFIVLCQSGITIGGHRSRGRGRLAALIRKYKPVLVILDPIRRMTPGVDENDSRAVSDYLGWLRRQQKENGCAIMCLHHFAKESKEDRMSQRPGRGRRITHRVRGSSDFLAWYDSLILVERDTEIEHKVHALHRGARRLDETIVSVDWQDATDSISLSVGPSTLVPGGQHGTIIPPAPPESDDDDPGPQGQLGPF